MQGKYYAVAVEILGLVMTGLMGCFDEPSGWGPARQAHELREFNYGPKHEVCDAYGGNCMVCDVDNDYCRRLPSSYSSYPPYSRGYY
jgi:hypothetical protein